MIYHVTYPSQGLQVKGYLSLPYGYQLLEEEARHLLAGKFSSVEHPAIQLNSPLHPSGQDFASKKWPVFIYCRGGIGNFGKVRTPWVEEFAMHDHIVFAPSYRGTEGGEGRDLFGGDDKEDVYAAVKLLSELPFVDAGRISIMGFSRGSINAAYTARTLPSIHKLVLWSGVSDMTQTYEERVDLRRTFKRVIGGPPSKVPEAYEERSPVNIAGELSCPVLIVHGTEDVQVSFSQGEKMYHSLSEVDADVNFHRYEGLGHHFPQETHRAAIARMFEWIGEGSGNTETAIPM
ncbi:prolyl oligopeptidase family serine peptidase [Paenibacillus sp. Marseille-Q4541]|uniref:alpha/beta hydrolase family protein n=1 Tax=Paenibacillus sp. Marseille-Q4541 TaxID=2831522 RepID=UPI001BA5EA01|nr:prolyl oligopeptidase family serine peptidase [Paenibacillus sp. Marseille-Q4541]